MLKIKISMFHSSCFFLKLVTTKRLLFLGHRSLIKDKTQTVVINIVSFRNSINLTRRFVCYSTHIFKSDLKCPLKQMTRLYIFCKRSGNENKSLKFLTVMNTKFTQQLIKQQLFTADVDIKSWLKTLYKQNKS